MTPEERQLISGLFERMRSYGAPDKDRDAEALIAREVRANPDATYMLVQSVLGYSVQGLAVAHSVLLARGVAPAFILLLMVFLFVFTLPVFLPSAALLGLSDVWLDYRRLEASPREGA